MQDLENKDKKAERTAGIAPSKPAMEWLRREKARWMSEGKRAPTYADIIDELIAGMTQKGQADLRKIPYEQTVTDVRNVVEDNSDPTAPVDLEQIRHSLQIIESKCGIDYQRVEQALIDALHRLHINQLSSEFTEIARTAAKDSAHPARSRKRHLGPDRKRLPA